jgi:hypothetical protein
VTNGYLQQSKAKGVGGDGGGGEEDEVTQRLERGDERVLAYRGVVGAQVAEATEPNSEHGSRRPRGRTSAASGLGSVAGDLGQNSPVGSRTRR